MAARLSGGWTRLKVVGEVEPTQILVNKQTGEFGTMLVGSEEIRAWDTLAAAEAFIKELQEAGAISAVEVDSPFGDEVVRLKPLRVRKIGREWVRMDGTRIGYHRTLLVPDEAAAAAIEAKRAEHEATKKTMLRLRDEAWEIVRGMQKLDDTSND